LETRTVTIQVPPTVWDSVAALPREVVIKFVKCCRLISRDLRHPSLGAEIVKVGDDRFVRCRIDLEHRIHMTIPSAGIVALRAVGRHKIEGVG